MKNPSKNSENERLIEICENSHKIEHLEKKGSGNIQFSALKFKTTSFSNNVI
jgi:hypothetical protein